MVARSPDFSRIKWVFRPEGRPEGKRQMAGRTLSRPLGQHTLITCIDLRQTALAQPRKAERLQGHRALEIAVWPLTSAPDERLLPVKTPRSWRAPQDSVSVVHVDRPFRRWCQYLLSEPFPPPSLSRRDLRFVIAMRGDPQLSMSCHAWTCTPRSGDIVEASWRDFDFDEVASWFTTGRA